MIRHRRVGQRVVIHDEAGVDHIVRLSDCKPKARPSLEPGQVVRDTKGMPWKVMETTLDGVNVKLTNGVLSKLTTCDALIPLTLPPAQKEKP